ncbi:NACHT domain-containing protein [Fusarium keratoplasticum]|nr:NACHT domain-containing protein [Fusarium keratoplasticum]
MPNKMSHVIAFIKGSNIVVWVDEEGTLTKVDLDTGAFLDPIKFPTEPIAVSPDGQTIITYTKGKTGLDVWAWDNPETNRRTLDGCIPEYGDVVISPDNTKLVCVSKTRYGHIQIWDLTTGFCLTIHCGADFPVPRSLAFSPDGTMVAFGNKFYGTVKLYDTIIGTVQVFSGHSDAIRAVAISPNGRLSASGCDDKTIKIWDPTVGAPLDSDAGPNEGPKDWLLSPNGLWVASLTYDNVIRMWSSVTSEYVFNLREPLPGSDGKLAGILKFSPCDRWLAFKGRGFITIWDTTTWEIQHELPPRFLMQGYFLSLKTNIQAEVPDKSDTVEIWDLQTRKLKSTFPSFLYGHDNLKQMSFSSNGLWLALASEKTVEIWDWAAKECMQVVNEAPGEISWHPTHGGLLHTSHGSYCVQGSTGNCSVNKVQTQDEDDEEDEDQIQMIKGGEWVTVQGLPVLWVPPQYRPRFSYHDEFGPFEKRVVDCNKSGIAMLDNCDRVIYIGFDVPEIALKF